MANYNADTADIITIAGDDSVQGPSANSGVAGSTGGDYGGYSTTYYLMQCTDASTAATATWEAVGAPDATASTTKALQAIAQAGLTQPVRNIRFLATWTV